jgi:hypothetical protein
MRLKITCSGFAFVIKEASFIFHLVLYEKSGINFFDSCNSWKSIKLDFFSNYIKFYKTHFFIPICYLCICILKEKDTKAILIRSRGLESARNVGRFYTKLQQLLPEISLVSSFKIMYGIRNISSEDAWHNFWDFFFNYFYKFV